MGDVTHVVYAAIFGDVVVIATFDKALAFVHGVEGFRGEVTCATGCGAVNHDQGDVSLFNHCFLWVVFLSCVFLFCPPSVPLWGRRLSGEVLFPLAAGRSPSGVGRAVAVVAAALRLKRENQKRWLSGPFVWG